MGDSPTLFFSRAGVPASGSHDAALTAPCAVVCKLPSTQKRREFLKITAKLSGTFSRIGVQETILTSSGKEAETRFSRETETPVTHARRFEPDKQAVFWPSSASYR
uniref:Uncharacterized protein n=1 Tax=Coccidioides posadasii RMSCC 3488 TaxID=454284 RepID=A0A0J6I6E8_COCPO|nr:hypothetical protein CPAG_03333 [Coccidioides posadasii RMSCC 3488]